MQAEAIKKLRDEMDKEKDNQYVQLIGNFLIGHLESNPQDAEKILNKDKSIAKSLDAMKKEAEKKKQGNHAMLTPNEGFRAVLGYYGIIGDVVTQDVRQFNVMPKSTDYDLVIKLQL